MASMPVAQYAPTAEFPSELRGLSLSRGECRAQQRGQLTAVVWQDKRQVAILSTITDADSCATVTRKEKDGTHTTLQCPTAIVTYNDNMAGVDRETKCGGTISCGSSEKLQIHILVHHGCIYHQFIHSL